MVESPSTWRRAAPKALIKLLHEALLESEPKAKQSMANAAGLPPSPAVTMPNENAGIRNPGPHQSQTPPCCISLASFFRAIYVTKLDEYG